MVAFIAGPRLARLVLAGLALLLIGVGAARAETTVAFYSHGWGVGPNGMMYFPHAFVVIHHADKPGDPPKEAAWGYTAASTWDIGVFAHPAKGMVDQPDPTYRKKATLHFTVTASDAQYAAMQQVIQAWGGPDSPLYDLDHHNCVGFAAAMASALGLQTPATIGRDPAKFLEGVRKLNPGRLVEASASAAAP
jgi:hypothetical protein